MESKDIDKYILDKTLEAYIENEIERRIKEYPVRLVIDGDEYDTDEVNFGGGEIEVVIGSEFIHSTTINKTLVLTEILPSKMVG